MEQEEESSGPQLEAFDLRYYQKERQDRENAVRTNEYERPVERAKPCHDVADYDWGDDAGGLAAEVGWRREAPTHSD